MNLLNTHPTKITLFYCYFLHQIQQDNKHLQERLNIMNTQNTYSPRTTHFAYCVSTALALLSTPLASAGTTPTEHPALSTFSTTPLHFKSTNHSLAKPNVMLLMDDSNTMHQREFEGIARKPGTETEISADGNYYEWIGADNSGKKGEGKCSKWLPEIVDVVNPNYIVKNVKVPANTWCVTEDYTGDLGKDWIERKNFGSGDIKAVALQKTLTKLINKPKSKNYYWGLMTINNPQDDTAVFLNDLTDKHKNKMIKAIDKMFKMDNDGYIQIENDGDTRTTQAYYNAVLGFKNGSEHKTGLIDQIKYRCQPNHIILLSDGKPSNINPIEYDGSEDSDNSYPDNYRARLKKCLAENKDFKACFGKPDSAQTYKKPPISYEEWQYCDEESNEQGLCNYNRDYGLAFLSSRFANMDLKVVEKKAPKKYRLDDEKISWDADPKKPESQIFDKQTVITHTIAFGYEATEVPSSDYIRKYLENGAVYGGGKFEKAKDAQALEKAFENILTQVVPFKGYTAVAPAVVNTDITGIAATASLNSGSWSSQLHFARLNAQGELQKYQEDVKDSAGNIIHKKGDLLAPQQAAFPNLSDTVKENRRVLLTHSNGTTTFFDGKKAGIDNKSVDIESKNDKEWQNTYIPWLTRYSSITDQEIDTKALASDNPYLRYRVRANNQNTPERHMGDILGAPVLAIGKRMYIGDIADSTQKNAIKDYKYEYLVTAANDGMLHIFTAQKPNDNINTGITDITSAQFKPYALRASYIPGGIARKDSKDTILHNLKWQMDPDYGKKDGAFAKERHIYLLNGGIASRTTDDRNEGIDNKKEQRQTFIVANAGQGGKGAFALNIGGLNRQSGEKVGVDAGLDTLTSNLPLWMKSANGLGYTISTPGIGRVATTWNNGTAKLNKDVHYAAFIANGIDGEDSTSALYVYDALGQDVGTDNIPTSRYRTGELIKKLSVSAGGTNASEKGKGLSSPTPVDIDRDGVVDVVYAGDYTGNMYRFDLRGSPENWQVFRIYQGDKTKPILAAPSVKQVKNSNEYVVMFGTGSDIYDSDLTDDSQQAFYGIYDDLNKRNSTEIVAATEENLLAQTLSLDANNTNVRQISNNPFNRSLHKGWYIKLINKGMKGLGERVMTKASVLGETVFFTTRTYISDSDNSNNNVCSAGVSSGHSWLMGVNADNGGKLTHNNTRFVQNGKIITHAGLKYSGILSELNHSFGSQTDKESFNNEHAGYGKKALALNNEVSSSGYSDKLGKENNTIPRKLLCGKQEGANALFYTASDTGFGKIDVQLVDCPTNARRLSWREIF